MSVQHDSDCCAAYQQGLLSCHAPSCRERNLKLACMHACGDAQSGCALPLTQPDLGGLLYYSMLESSTLTLWYCHMDCCHYCRQC